jgi:hypothetical protein
LLDFWEARMVLKGLFAALLGAALLCAGGAANAADAYRPGEFLSLDLSRALLSPRPLGPPAEFAVVPVEARGDARAEARPEPLPVVRRTRVAHSRAGQPAAAEAVKPIGAARTKLARRHDAPRGNPLDAQAFDTRIPASRHIQTSHIQTWPCKSGGICDWK